MLAPLLLSACSFLPGQQASDLTEGAATAPAAPAPPPAAVVLAGRAVVEDGRLTVLNDSAQPWNNVTAVANDTLTCNVGIVHPHDQAGIQLQNCGNGPLDGAVTSVRVTATEGYFVTTIAPEPAKVKAVPQKKPAAVAPAEAPRMVTHYDVSGGFGPARRITVYNDTAFEWTGCTVTVNGNFHYQLGTLPGERSEGIMMVRFKDATGNTFTSNQQITTVKVKCQQGTATAG